MQTTLSAPLFEAIAPETAGMPLYRVVKRSLLEAIERGSFASGDTLPSEAEIAGAMGVSIGTLRRAVDELAAERILVRRQGRGTFVASDGGDRFVLPFFPVEQSDGSRAAPRVETVSFERARALAAAAEALQLAPGDPVFQIENLLSLHGAAVVLDRLILPATLFKGLTEKRFRERPGSIYRLYQTDFNLVVLRAQERARATSADRHAARLLGLSPGQAVMQVRRTALSFGDRPIEYRVSILNTTHHDYVHWLSPPTGPT